MFSEEIKAWEGVLPIRAGAAMQVRLVSVTPSRVSLPAHSPVIKPLLQVLQAMP